MTSFVWTAGIFGLFLLWYRRRHEVGRLEAALTLALLGTTVQAAGSEASEIINNPVVFERAVRGALSGIALLVVLPKLREVTQKRFKSYGVPALAFYGVLAGLSTVWSEAPLVTAAKAFELGVGIAITIAYSAAEPGRLTQAVNLLILSRVPFLAVSLVGFFLLPSLFTSNDMRPGFVLARTMGAPFSHSNGLSATAALVAAYAFAELIKTGRSRWSYGMISLAALTLLFASARQGVAVTLLTVFALLLIHRARRLFFVVAPLLLVLGPLVFDTIYRAMLRGQNPDLFGSLTGRVTWWAAAIEAWTEHPFTGFGFGAGGRFVALDRAGFGTVSNLHNGYVETLIGIGLMGLMALFLIVSYAFRYAWRKRHAEPALLAILISISLHTTVSLGYGGWLGVDFFLLALLASGSEIGGPSVNQVLENDVGLLQVGPLSTERRDPLHAGPSAAAPATLLANTQPPLG
jgi:O-antigen ligase